MPIPYRHTQYGLVTIASLAVVAIVAIVFLLQHATMAGLVVAGIMLLTILAFASLTVEVSGEAVRFHFGIGLIRKTFLMGDIERVAVVRNSWLYGWGIRYTPHGWLYNVSGLGAVELQLRSGKKVRIGSDEPELLARAIEEALGIRMRGGTLPSHGAKATVL